MNCLVLGGCGFIGSHIVDALLTAGHGVRVLDHSPENLRPALPDVDYHFADFTDKAALARALDGMDVVLHTLSTTVPASSNSNPEGDVQSNLLGTLRLLDAMRAVHIQRIVFLSSGGTVYGNTLSLPVAENHPLHPLCSYGVVKVAIENYLFMYQQLYGLQPVIIRPSNPYGPRQGKIGSQGVISTFAHRLLHHEPISIWGDGSIIRDFFHVEDLARLCMMAAHGNHTGIYNAGAGEGHSLLEIIAMLSEISGLSPNIDFLEARAFDAREVVLDIHQVQESFGWKPQISLRDGLSSYMDWLSGSPGEKGEDTHAG